MEYKEKGEQAEEHEQDKKLNEEKKALDAQAKKFGLLISVLLLIVTNIAVYYEWKSVIIFFLLMMYFFTGVLWVPFLIRWPYKFIARLLPQKRAGNPKGVKSNPNKEKFHKN